MTCQLYEFGSGKARSGMRQTRGHFLSKLCQCGVGRCVTLRGHQVRDPEGKCSFKFRSLGASLTSPWSWSWVLLVL